MIGLSYWIRIKSYHFWVVWKLTSQLRTSFFYSDYIIAFTVHPIFHISILFSKKLHYQSALWMMPLYCLKIRYLFRTVPLPIWRIWFKIFSRQKLNKRIVCSEWPPTSPDCNPLDYYFCEKVEIKAYENTFNSSSEEIQALKNWIRKI